MACSVRAAYEAGNASPNMGRPLTEASFFTSSWITSQCSASRPFSIRMTSTTIQFAGEGSPHVLVLVSPDELQIFQP